MNNILRTITNFIKKYSNNIYIFAVIFYIIAFILLDNTILASNYSTIFSIIKYIAVFFVLIKILVCDIYKYTTKTFGILLILFIYFAFISFYCDNRYFLQLFVLIIGAKNVSFEKIVKYVLISEILLLTTLIILSLTGVITNFSSTRYGLMRYALGFKYTSSISGYIWGISLLFVFLKNKKLKAIDFIGLISINYIFYLITASRNGFYSSIILLALTIGYNFLQKYQQKINNIITYIAKFLPLILVIFSITISLIYNPKNEYMVKVNKTFSGRIYLQNNAIKSYPINLFGRNIEWVTNYDIKMNKKKYKSSDMNYVDNSYINILLNFGVVLTLLLLWLFYKLVEYNHRNKNDFNNLLLIVIFLHAVIDPHLIKISVNIFLLQFSNILVNFIKASKNKKFDNYLSLKEIQTEQKNMLKKIINFFDENHLTYFVCGGTLLGAIRHKGFIPWDDDIDILMPRPDYLKLQNIALSKKIDETLEIHSYELGNLNDPFCKIYNLNTTMEKYTSLDEYDIHMWIDIFPLDGLPKSEKKIKRIFQKSIFWRKLLKIRKLRDERVIEVSKTKIEKILKPFVKFFVDFLPKTFYVKRINKLCLKYSYEKSKYVGGIAWGYGPEEKMLKSEVDKIVKVDFEKMKVKTFSCWDYYLHNLYGDYMKLPPKKEQIAHIMNISYLNKNN